MNPGVVKQMESEKSNDIVYIDYRSIDLIWVDNKMQTSSSSVVKHQRICNLISRLYQPWGEEGCCNSV